MAKRSKFFCIAVEGATCDGRTLDRNALQEMADAYDPKTYGARINMEHIRGFSADPPFNAYGDVVALETREVELNLGGSPQKKLGLFAQIDALDALVELKEKGQKLYSSIELNPNFAGTGKAYLQGLAVTDSPASLGTEVMEFATGQVKAGRDSLFADRKAEKGNFVSAAQAIEGLEFSEAPTDPESKKMFASLTSFLDNFGSKPDNKPEQQPATPPVPANDNLAAQVGEGFTKLTAAMEQQGKEYAAEIGKVRADFNALKRDIENTDRSTAHRPNATGQNGNFAITDC